MFVLVKILLSATIIAQVSNNHATAQLETEEIGLTTAELIELRGFKAVNHYVTMSDGYILNVVRLTCPLINGGESGLSNKSVTLFVHGTFSSANGFILNSDNVRPKDYSQYDASSMKSSTLEKLLANEPSARSLPFLLAVFGHEVWFVNRRGTLASIGRTNGKNGTDHFGIEDGEFLAAKVVEDAMARLSRAGTNFKEILPVFLDIINDILQSASSKFNSDYWAFSLDPQISIDLPTVIDYVRRESKRDKISIVGHSAGGTITLTTLAHQPEIAEKLGQVILWAPATFGGRAPAEAIRFIVFNLLSRDYVGAFLTFEGVMILRKFFTTLCTPKLIRETLCQPIINLIFGDEWFNQKLRPGFLYELFGPISSWEIAQLTQCIFHENKQLYFDYNVARKNLEVYNDLQPPAYNFSMITSKNITLFAGISDGLVNQEDVRATIREMKVPVNFQVIANPDDNLFNHLSYLLNDNIGPTVNIPCLQKLELYS